MSLMVVFLEGGRINSSGLNDYFKIIIKDMSL